MKSNRDRVVERALKLSKDLLVSSDESMLLAQDDGCVTLCGVFRDCGHKLKLQAQLESERHLTRVGKNSKKVMNC